MKQVLVLGAVLVGLIGGLASAKAQIQTMQACQVENAPQNCNQGNMWAIDITVPVPNGAYVHVSDPGCMNDATGDIAKVLQGAVIAVKPELAMFSGTIGKVLAGPVGDYLRNQGGDVGRYFSPYAKNGALCAPVIVVVPKDATVLGFRLFSAEASGEFARCQAEADCPIGWSKWQADPLRQGNNTMQTVTGVFMNWSHDRQRRARMVVFYNMPPNQRPLTEM